MTFSEHIKDRSIVAVPAYENESPFIIEIQKDLFGDFDIEVTLAPHDRFREGIAFMIRGYRHFLHCFRYDAIADGGLRIEEKLRFRVLVGSVKQNNLMNVLMVSEEGEQFLRVDRPSVLALRMEHVCPVDENQRSAIEIEKRCCHAACILHYANAVTEHKLWHS